MSGNFDGKMIVSQALMDEAAYPWQADWYRSRIKAALGSQFEDRYRLYFIDNTMHTTQTASPGDPRPVATTRVVSYQGALQQALRDLSAWVEKGTAPPESTSYKVVDGQVQVPLQRASERACNRSSLCRRMAARAPMSQSVKSVDFRRRDRGAAEHRRRRESRMGLRRRAATIRWSSEIKPEARVSVKTTHAFTKPGTYFPALRVTSSTGRGKNPYAQVLNLGRVRVVVT